jgi:two-component system cell cycle sensor histidine kinase/response regulator CckA
MATILVVDDDADVNEMATLVLAHYGHDVRSASDGAAALNIVRNEPALALMLTDVVMPLMDGITLANRVRAMRPEMPVIFVSGYMDGILVPEAERTAFLRKPWRATQLASEVDKMLGTAA